MLRTKGACYSPTEKDAVESIYINYSEETGFVKGKFIRLFKICAHNDSNLRLLPKMRGLQSVKDRDSRGYLGLSLSYRKNSFAATVITTRKPTLMAVNSQKYCLV